MTYGDLLTGDVVVITTMLKKPKAKMLLCAPRHPTHVNVYYYTWLLLWGYVFRQNIIVSPQSADSYVCFDEYDFVIRNGVIIFRGQHVD